MFIFLWDDFTYHFTIKYGVSTKRVVLKNSILEFHTHHCPLYSLKFPRFRVCKKNVPLWLGVFAIYVFIAYTYIYIYVTQLKGWQPSHHVLVYFHTFTLIFMICLAWDDVVKMFFCWWCLMSVLNFQLFDNRGGSFTPNRLRIAVNGPPDSRG